jgi:hypothetical protein
MVSATNNGNEYENVRFANELRVHPSFWNFLLTIYEELERVERDISSILPQREELISTPLPCTPTPSSQKGKTCCKFIFTITCKEGEGDFEFIEVIHHLQTY